MSEAEKKEILDFIEWVQHKEDIDAWSIYEDTEELLDEYLLTNKTK